MSMKYKYDVGDKVLVDPKTDYVLSGEFVYITSRFEGHNGPCYHVCSEYGTESTYYEKRLIEVATNKKENNKMEKLTGYKKVAGVVLDGCDAKTYNFAVYDEVQENEAKGKLVVVQTQHGLKLGKVEYFVDAAMANVPPAVNITAEVVAFVDTSAYAARVENRTKKAELRRQMDKMISELDETEKYRKYAEMFPEFGKMFDEFNSL